MPASDATVYFAPCAFLDCAQVTGYLEVIPIWVNAVTVQGSQDIYVLPIPVGKPPSQSSSPSSREG